MALVELIVQMILFKGVAEARTSKKPLPCQWPSQKYPVRYAFIH